MAKDSKDGFDNLFEPFDLASDSDQAAPRSADDPQPIPPRQATTGDVPVVGEAKLYCASCGNPNDAANRHCELCGARLARSHTPIAPQPMLRTTAGARALVVLSAIVLGVALLALVINVFGGDDAAVAESTIPTPTSLATLPIAELVPIRADCTLTLDGFPCSALIDDDTDNRWNATEGGIGAELTFFFSPPVQITEMFFMNVEDEERFSRNARIKGVDIVIDDLAQATIRELDDTNTEPQRIQIRSLRTSSLTVTITSAYPGTSFDGKEPFPELALQGIQFFGRTAPEASG